MGYGVAAIIFLIFGLIMLYRTVRIVPQTEAWVVERLGKYSTTLEAGIHILIPFLDSVRYKHSLKEIGLDIAEQVCITKDNVQVAVDGILFFKVMDAKLASYGVANFVPAIVNLAQTTLRSEIGKIELGRVVEEREHINNALITALDHATDAWGIKVIRYEIKTITPPEHITTAMEKQKSSDMERVALINQSQGDREAKINRAEGVKQEAIKNSEAKKIQSINEADGQAAAILAMASATAEGIRKVAESIAIPGGKEAVQLRVAEAYIQQFGQLARANNTMIVPATVSDISGMVASAMAVLDKVGEKPKLATPPTKV